jgi:DNA-binding NarL/FixJ family response regulator
MTHLDDSSDGFANGHPHALPPSFPVTLDTLAKLEQLAKARSQDAAATLSQLVEAEIRRLDITDTSCLPLTAKQQVVIQKLRSGLSVKEVAASMNVSEQTVRTHILRARTRLGQSDLLSLRYL